MKVKQRLKHALTTVVFVLSGLAITLSAAELDRSGWDISANNNNAGIRLAIDGKSNTRWTTQAPQEKGQQIVIDFNESVTFDRIELDVGSSINDSPRRYSVRVSDNGTRWTTVKKGDGNISGSTVIEFEEQTAKFVKIKQLGSDNHWWWSIAELRIHSGDTETESEVKTQIPSGLPNSSTRTAINTHYNPKTYLYMKEYDVHFFGTEGISEWTMLGARDMVRSMIDNLKSSADRDKFKNFHVFAITNDDPDVPGGRPGHKNTGNESYMVFTQELVCEVAQGTLNTQTPPQWRGWDTPIHEFGHSIELALGLRNATVEYYIDNTSWAEGSVHSEFFAWAMQGWFNADLSKSAGFRDNLPQYQRDYYGAIFNQDDEWTPICDGKP